MKSKLESNLITAIAFEVLILLLAFVMHAAEWDTVKWLFVFIGFILGCYIYETVGKIKNYDDRNPYR